MDYNEANAAFEYGKGDHYVILIHGFPSIPYDVIPLGRHLAEQGFHVIGVKLPGFGGTKEELLHHADWHLWYAEIERNITEITAKQPKNIFISGISMGGTATLYTASQHPEIKALAPINGPVLIKEKSSIFVGLFAKFIKYFAMPFSGDFVLKPGGKHDPILQELYERRDNKGVLPAVATEVKWFRETDKNLIKITQPLLICQSSQDHTVWLKNPEYILSKVSSKVKQIIWYPNSDHNVIYDNDSEQLFADVTQFFKQHMD